MDIFHKIFILEEKNIFIRFAIITLENPNKKE